MKIEIKGRIRLLRELGCHWSIITGGECFEIFDDNLVKLTQKIDEVSLNEKEITKRIFWTVHVLS